MRHAGCLAMAFAVACTSCADAAPARATFGAEAEMADVSKRVEVAFGGGKPCSLALHFRVDQLQRADEPAWSDTSPMTLFRMESAKPEDPVLFGRVMRDRIFVTFFKKDASSNFDTGTTYVADQPIWHQLAITDTGHEMNLYLDGRPVGYAWHGASLPLYRMMQLGVEGRHRFLKGKVRREVAFFDRVLSDAEVAALYAEKTPEADRLEAADERVRQPSAAVSEEPCYRALQVVAEGRHALIDQLGVSAEPVAWPDSGGRDLLIRGESRLFRSRLALYPFQGVHNGLPVYGAGVTITNLPFFQFQACPNKSGTFDLVADGSGTRFGKWHLVCYKNVGAPGKPQFEAPRQIRFDGKPLMASSASGASGWVVADIDGDGAPDFVYAKSLALGGDTRFPFEGSPWTGKEQKYAGPGKGYDLNGRWIGRDNVTAFYWARGCVDEKGDLSFGAPQEVETRTKGYPLVWKGVGVVKALQVVKLAGRRYLLLAGHIDELLAVPLEVREDTVVAGEASPVLKSGAVLPDTFLPFHIRAADLDGDGVQELLLDGNPGVVAVLKGARIGAFESVGVAQMRGGALAAETLTSPCRFDWDGDGKDDVLTGDASGQLLFWGGTEDPWSYRPAMPMTAGGRPVKPVAGMRGSIQGPNEKRWGYLKVAAGMWGGAKALITCDIKGDLMLYRPGTKAAELQAGVPFTYRGVPFKVAWRSRPDIIQEKTRFAKVPHDALLIMDWDGDLSVAVPEQAGGVDFRETLKLQYADGETIRLCGPAGLWGRGAVTLTDWDGDGRLDLIFGTNRSCQQFFCEEAAKLDAQPFFLRNEGSNQKPRFARARPLRLKSGEPLAFGVHNATPWATDLNGDGRLDLLVGAENGKVYGFLREEFADK